MQNVTLRYGGATGTRHPLRVADEYLAVRTRSRLPVQRAQLSGSARSLLARFDPVVDFHEAGVQLYRCRSRTVAHTVRDPVIALFPELPPERDADYRCHPAFPTTRPRRRKY